MSHKTVWYGSGDSLDLPSLDSLTVSDILGLATMEPHEQATFESSFQGYVDQMEHSRSRKDNERRIKKELLKSRIQGLWEECSHDSSLRSTLDLARELFASRKYNEVVDLLNRLHKDVP